MVCLHSHYYEYESSAYISHILHILHILNCAIIICSPLDSALSNTLPGTLYIAVVCFVNLYVDWVVLIATGK